MAITLREFYNKVDGNYEDVVGRLMKEDRILKYLLKFRDSADYNTMLTAFETKDWELLFRMSHNLKGMCQNLGIECLAKASSELCETVRHGAPEMDITSYVDATTAAYKRAIDAIGLLD